MKAPDDLLFDATRDAVRALDHQWDYQRSGGRPDARRVCKVCRRCEEKLRGSIPERWIVPGHIPGPPSNAEQLTAHGVPVPELVRPAKADAHVKLNALLSVGGQPTDSMVAHGLLAALDYLHELRPDILA